MSEILNDFERYMDKHGLVQPNGKTGGNGVLYTAEAIVSLVDRQAMTREFKAKLELAYMSCIHPAVLYGLPIRAPGHADQEGPDDFVGWAAASKFLGRADWAYQILKYGRENPVKLWRGLIKLRYFYNNVMPGTPWHPCNEEQWAKLPWWSKFLSKITFAPKGHKFNASAWLGRQPQLITTLQFAAGEPVHWLRKWYWRMVVSLAELAKKEKHDTWILTYLSCRVASGADPKCNERIKSWFRVFKTVYPRGTGELYGDYFNNWSHPLCKWNLDRW